MKEVTIRTHTLFESNFYLVLVILKSYMQLTVSLSDARCQ